MTYKQLEALSHDLEPIEHSYGKVTLRIDFKRVEMVRLAKEARK